MSEHKHTAECCCDDLAMENAKLRDEVEHLKARYENACLGCDTVVGELKAANLRIEKLKDKYETCEQCASSTDAGVFCVPCWNRVNLQLDDMRKGFQVIAMTQTENHSLGDAQKIAGMALKLPVTEKRKCEKCGFDTPCRKCGTCVHCCACV